MITGKREGIWKISLLLLKFMWWISSAPISLTKINTWPHLTQEPEWDTTIHPLKCLKLQRPTIPNTGEDVKQQGFVHRSMNRNWYTHFGKVWHYLLILDRTYDPAILLSVLNSKACKRNTYLNVHIKSTLVNPVTAMKMSLLNHLPWGGALLWTHHHPSHQDHTSHRLFLAKDRPQAEY